MSSYSGLQEALGARMVDSSPHFVRNVCKVDSPRVARVAGTRDNFSPSRPFSADASVLQTLDLPRFFDTCFYRFHFEMGLKNCFQSYK